MAASSPSRRSIIPVFLLLTALVARRGQLVHPQALAPEPRRRGRARGGRRVPHAALELRRQPDRPGRNGDRRQGAAVRGRDRHGVQQEGQQPVPDHRQDQRHGSDGRRRIGRRQPVPGPHARPRLMSPNGGIWTDVIAREANIRTVAGTFGISLPSIAAQARVEVEPDHGVATAACRSSTRPGDQIECVWAQIRRARRRVNLWAFDRARSNPILLHVDPTTPGLDSRTSTNISSRTRDDDVASRNTGLGARTARRRATSRPTTRAGFPPSAPWTSSATGRRCRSTGSTSTTRQQPPGTEAAAEAPSLLAQRRTTAGARASSTPRAPIRVPVPRRLLGRGRHRHQQCQRRDHGRARSSRPRSAPRRTVPYDTPGWTPNLHTVTGTITCSRTTSRRPTGPVPGLHQVGRDVPDGQLAPVDGQGRQRHENCRGNAACSGTFQGKARLAAGRPRHPAAVLHGRPAGSVPLIGELDRPAARRRSFPALGSTGPFTITFQHTAVDKEHVVLIRDSVQSSGNRTRRSDCGTRPSRRAGALERDPRTAARRAHAQHALGLVLRRPRSSADPWDCIQLEQGNKTGPISKGVDDRFACTPNNWVTGGPLPPDGDQRWAYIILTGTGDVHGRQQRLAPDRGLPPRLRHGLGRQAGTVQRTTTTRRAATTTRAPSSGATSSTPITLDPTVIIGDGEVRPDDRQHPVQAAPRPVRAQNWPNDTARLADRRSTGGERS